MEVDWNLAQDFIFLCLGLSWEAKLTLVCLFQQCRGVERVSSVDLMAIKVIGWAPDFLGFYFWWAADPEQSASLLHLLRHVRLVRLLLRIISARPQRSLIFFNMVQRQFLASCCLQTNKHWTEQKQPSAAVPNQPIPSPHPLCSQ